jgi:hypothetical protein
MHPVTFLHGTGSAVCTFRDDLLPQLTPCCVSARTARFGVLKCSFASALQVYNIVLAHPDSHSIASRSSSSLALLMQHVDVANTSSCCQSLVVP